MTLTSSVVAARAVFARRGAMTAAGALVPGLQAMALLAVAAACFGADAAAEAGVIGQIAGLATVALVGVTVLVLHRCAARAPGWLDRLAELRVFSLAACAAAALAYLAAIGLAAAGSGLSPVGLAYAASVLPAVAATPAVAWCLGAMQLANRDGVNLAWSIATAAASLAAAAVAWAARLDPAAGLALIGGAWSLATLASVWDRVRRTRELERDAAPDARSAEGRPRVAWRSLASALGGSALGAADGIILMAAFILIVEAARGRSAEAAVAVLFAINVARLFVLPLKQFGMVGGRMLAGADPSDRPAFSRAFLSVVLGIMAGAAVLVVALVAVGGAPSSVSLALAGLVAAQLLVEPFASYRSAVRKVLEGPAASLAPLAATAAAAVGAVLLLSGPLAGAGAALGAEAIWVIWALGRLAFAVAVHLGARRVASRRASAERA